MEWQPPISEQEAQTEQGKSRQAKSVLQNKDRYLLDKKDEEMAHYLKNLPAGAKKHLRERQKRTEKAEAQAQGLQEFETVEMPAIDVLEQQAQDQDHASERNLDLVYDPDQDTPCIKGNQRYFLVTYLKKGRDADRDWFRIWCACSGQVDADKSLAKIREENPYADWWDIGVMPAGAWSPWPPKDSENQEYANKEMNDFMKAHMENLGKALKHDKERQADLMAQEDINEKVRKEKALKKKHKRWIKRQRDRAQALGITIEELIEQEGKASQYAIAMGATQPQWDGDLAPEAYELITVQEEEVLEDGTVELVEKTIRVKKQDALQKLKQNFDQREKALLQELADVQLRKETYLLALSKYGLTDDQIPHLTWEQLQAYNEPRNEQAAAALAKSKEMWKSEIRARKH